MKRLISGKNRFLYKLCKSMASVMLICYRQQNYSFSSTKNDTLVPHTDTIQQKRPEWRQGCLTTTKKQHEAVTSATPPTAPRKLSQPPDSHPWSYVGEGADATLPPQLTMQLRNRRV